MKGTSGGRAWKEGDDLEVIRKAVSQVDINRYAEASGDFNPIHVDEAFARRTPLKGTVAHGMMLLAYVSQMMQRSFGSCWAEGGKLKARFKLPARPGDTLTLSGKVQRLEQTRDDGARLECEYSCLNQDGEPLVLGEAWVNVRGGDRW